MIYINAYTSNKLTEYSEKAYDQGGLFFLDISESERNLCDQLNHEDARGGMYPDWNEIAFCCRKDWKSAKSWQIDTDVSVSEIKNKMHGYFDSPSVIDEIKTIICLYSEKANHKSPDYFELRAMFSNLFCLNKDVFETLWWCFDASDDEYKKLMDDIAINIIDCLVEEISFKVDPIDYPKLFE